MHCAPLIFPSGTLQVTGKSDDRNDLTGGPRGPELVCCMVLPLFYPITCSKPAPAIIIFQNTPPTQADFNTVQKFEVSERMRT